MIDHVIFKLRYNQIYQLKTALVPETIDSGPVCITNLFQNKSVAYLFKMEWSISI